MSRPNEIIEFKTETIKQEFLSDKLNERLRFIIYAMAGYIYYKFKKSVTLTSIYRENDKGVHGYWRGIDIRTFYYTNDEISDILKYFNYQLDYGDSIHSTIVYHDVGMGIHFHVQVSRNSYTKIK